MARYIPPSVASPRRSGATAYLAVTLDAGESPPSEFRIFKAGWNDTEKGRFLFDAQAARDVLSARAKKGVDIPIDLEHQMLTADPSPDPTARDARGWCRLEVRPDGSLWAVGVKWTPDGAARLTERRQRYISPAFTFDEKTGRVRHVVNVAITALPATMHTPALVAASDVTLSGEATMIDGKIVKEALDALIAGDAEKALEILKGMIAAAAGGEAEELPAPESAAASEPPAEEPAADAAATSETPPAAEEEAEAAVAASSRLVRLTGKASISDALDEIDAWRKSHVELAEERARVAKDALVIELAKRRENAIALTRLGAETPSTTGLATGKLCKRLLDEPLAEQTARVAELLAARGGKLPPAPPARAAGAGPVAGAAATLTAEQLKICAETGCDPETFAALRSHHGS